MAIILDKPGFGEQFGSSFGTGLGRALEGLAQNKFQDIVRQQQIARNARGLSGLFPQQQAEQFAELDPLVLREVLKNLLPAARDAELNNLTEGIISGTEPEFESEGPDKQSLLYSRSKSEEESAKEPSLKIVGLSELSPGAVAAREMKNLEKKLTDPRLSPQQKSQLRKRIEDRQEGLEKKQEKIDKKTDPFVSKLTEDYEASQASDKRIGRMKELIKGGNLTNPLFFGFLDSLEHAIPSLGVGINLKGLLSPESQEFDKLSKDFLRDVKKVFGARVTQSEVMQFLKTIPTLAQSDEGKLRIIHNMELFNEASKAKKEVYDAIVEANGGYRPHNIEELVNKNSKKKIDEIAKRFESGYEKSAAKKEIEEEKNTQIRDLIAAKDSRRNLDAFSLGNLLSGF